MYENKKKIYNNENSFVKKLIYFNNINNTLDTH